MASSSSMPSPPVMKDEEPRNWSELPAELTSSIMLRLGAVEILENAQKVCTSWRRVSKEPSMWRKIDMRNLGTRDLFDYDLDKMCRRAVDRSEGGLVEIYIGNIGSDSLLTYIADRSSHLKTLGIEVDNLMTNEGIASALSKLPLLEELEVSSPMVKLDFKAIGYSCPKLKTLKADGRHLHCDTFFFLDLYDDDVALAIAENMPQLHHLQLNGFILTDTGLKAILDNCPHLEHLDLSKCENTNLSEIWRNGVWRGSKILDAPTIQPLILPPFTI